MSARNPTLKKIRDSVNSAVFICVFHACDDRCHCQGEVGSVFSLSDQGEALQTSKSR